MALRAEEDCGRCPATVASQQNLMADTLRKESCRLTENGWRISREEMSCRDNYVITLAQIVGGPRVETFSLPPQTEYQSPDIHWMPDSQSLTYVATHDGISNIWRQPLSGGPPKQLTNFQADKIFYFDVSPNGQEIVCSRGDWAHDMILIKNAE